MNENQSQKKNVEFEDGKQVEDYITELDSLTLDQDEKPQTGQSLCDVATFIPSKPEKKKEEEKPKIKSVEISAPTPEILPEQTIPVAQQEIPVEIAQPFLATETIVLPKKMFSFDDALERAVNKKFQKIDEKAAYDKDKVIETVSDKLLRFIEIATLDAPIIQPIPLPDLSPEPIHEAPLPVSSNLAKPESKPMKTSKIKIVLAGLCASIGFVGLLLLTVHLLGLF
jgi:hypothetical protein